MSSAMIATSSSALAYATLAELSTEMQTFDAILDNTGAYHTSPPFHPQLPVEIMLLIREELQSSLVYRAADDAVRALDAYEAAVRRSLCGDCLAYNQDVFGDDIWRWRWSGPCACRADRRRRHTHRETRPFRTLGDWLEHHLSSRTPASSIREAMSLVLGRHGCQSSALLPSAASSVGTLPETFVITASPSAVARCQGRIGEDTEWCSEIVLRKARRDLGLAVAASLDFALQRKIDAPGDSTTKEPVRQHSTILPSYALSAVAGGCAAVLTLPIVSIAFVVLVTCHYVRPSGIRVF
ncbi:hypothetical protein EV715DRAFT_277139 [Schizophyllum commune]